MQLKDKIKPIEELAKLVASLRAEGKKIVYCHGVFDLLHIGHIRYFEQARLMGDVLIVTVTPDRYVDKGPYRPAFTDALRAEAVASLNCVDYVAINEWPTAEETLRLLKPHVYVKGSEFKDTSSDITGKIAMEEQVVREIGAKLAFTEDIVFSSTTLINRYLSILPEENREYLNLFCHRHKLEDVIKTIDKTGSLNVLVVGDTILDEYQYCDAIGKSSKDPVLAVKYQSHDLFAGGALAVANHVANFAKTVKIVTVLGERDSREEFIRSNLHPNVSPYFVFQPNATTVIKRRFIESYTLNKLFEVYVMEDSGLPSEVDVSVCEWLKWHLPEYDVVIAADFGHGAISNNIVQALARNARFLTINVQANAGNRGFHTISRYPRADYVCMAEHEIRLEMRNLKGDLIPMMNEIAEKLNCRQMVVTRGKKGCLVRSKDGGIVAVPAFAIKTVDRVGAGDAFLSVTSLLSAQGTSEELIGFIGNVVGAQAVEIIGNKKSIDKLSVQKHIISLLK